jgi:hypothetical protein
MVGTLVSKTWKVSGALVSRRSGTPISTSFAPVVGSSQRCHSSPSVGSVTFGIFLWIFCEFFGQIFLYIIGINVNFLIFFVDFRIYCKFF